MRVIGDVVDLVINLFMARKMSNAAFVLTANLKEPGRL
jgi:hypothetical protein